MLVKCETPRCGALFDPAIQWVNGWRNPDSTTGDFDVTGTIPLGNCPVCRKPTPNEAA